MSGLFGLFGGSSAKHDRQIELGGFSDLSNVFNFALPVAKNLTGSGSDALNSTTNFWKTLLTGNRSQMMQANAPAINSTLSAADAAKRQAATMGTARGGGVATQNRTLGDTSRAAIDNSLLAARPKAAEEMGKLGSSEMADALNALGLGERTAADITSLASNSRATSQDLHNQAVGDVQTGIAQIIGAFGAAELG